MPELTSALQKHKGKLPRFTPAGREVDIYAIPYRDKIREKARQNRIKEQQQQQKGNDSATTSTTTTTSSKKHAKRVLQMERKRIEKEQRQAQIRQDAIRKGRNPDKKRGRQAQIVDEWDDLAKEERLYKRFKRGKITQDEYEAQMYK